MHKLSFALFAVVCLSTLSFGASVGAGQRCDTSDDCDGGLDCIRPTFPYKKRCLPITCAQGAANAVLDGGFDQKEYFAAFRAQQSGLRGNNNLDYPTGRINGQQDLVEFVKTNPPPIMEAFNGNYSACMHPFDVDERNRMLRESGTGVGVMWGVAALFAYWGKYITHGVDTGLGTVDLEFLHNCVGFHLGGDFSAADLLISIWSYEPTSIVSSTGDPSLTLAEEKQTGTRDFQFIPVLTAGPFGIQVGFPENDIFGEDIFTEITFGASFGAGLLGYTYCPNSEVSLA